MVATMLATSVHAVDLSSDTETREREPNPRAALSAVAMNIFFLPVRLPLTVLGAFFAGFTGFMTFGGKYAADDVFAAVDGTQVIDEHVVEGRKPLLHRPVRLPALTRAWPPSGTAETYREVSALQEWLAAKSLASLTLSGGERVLDVGCGDGRISAAIAAHVPSGSVLGVDASQHMVDFAAAAFPPAEHPNLRFAVADAAALHLAPEFDLAVSFNALHWVLDLPAALRGLHAALVPGAARCCASCRRARGARSRT
jgi:hypothetical protein